MTEMLLSLWFTNKFFAFPTLVLPRSGTRVLLSLALFAKRPDATWKTNVGKNWLMKQIAITAQKISSVYSTLSTADDPLVHLILWKTETKLLTVLERELQHSDDQYHNPYHPVIMQSMQKCCVDSPSAIKNQLVWKCSLPLLIAAFRLYPSDMWRWCTQQWGLTGTL